MRHYFINDDKLRNDRREITFRFFDMTYHFYTDSGVFSKTKVDYGSQILLEVLSKANLKGSFCDFGTGYGVIGIIMAALNELEVYSVDINKRALELALINSKLNQVNINFILSSGRLELNKLMDTIALNPPIKAGKQVIYKMFEDARDNLKPDGRFYIVIRKDHGALSALKELKNLFHEVEVVEKSKGFWVLLAYNRV